MDKYFPYFLQATYQFEGTCAALALPNGEDVLVDRGMRVSCVYQGDDTVLVTYSYYVYTPGVYGCKREIEQFPLRVGEKVVKKYYEQSSMRLNVI